MEESHKKAVAASESHGHFACFSCFVAKDCCWTHVRISDFFFTGLDLFLTDFNVCDTIFGEAKKSSQAVLLSVASPQNRGPGGAGAQRRKIVMTTFYAPALSTSVRPSLE
jgi:hypothetical protein